MEVGEDEAASCSEGLHVRPRPRSFRSPTEPSVLQLLEDNVNRFGEVVHVRVRLHVGVVFIARPAKETEGHG